MATANIAVWGLGPHAIKNILPALAQVSGLRFIGVSSRTDEVLRAVSSGYRCIAWADPAEMLASPDVDVVYVSTPIGLHSTHGQAVLHAGKHLWCEKPLAETADQVQGICDLSRRGRLTVAEGFMYLYHPLWEALREVIGSARLGRITDVSCNFGIPELERPGFRASKALGGGAFLDIGCYPLSLAVDIFQSEQPEIAFARIVSASDEEVDYAGQAVLLYGPDTVMRLNWRSGGSYRNDVDFWGTEGSVSVDRIFSKPVDYVPRICLRDRQGRETFSAGQAANHFIRMFEAFRGLLDNAASAEAERVTVERRAQLRQLVIDTSTKVTYG